MLYFHGIHQGKHPIFNAEETLTERTCIQIGVPIKAFRCIGSD